MADITNPQSPAEPPAPTLESSPKAIEMQAGDVQAFSVAPAGLLVEWSIEPPGSGGIDEHGIYRAPDKIDSLRSIVVLARTPGGAQYGTAAITHTGPTTGMSTTTFMLIMTTATTYITLPIPMCGSQSQLPCD
jgi:hypothetical protein